MRRIVTGVGADGRSTVVSIDEVDDIVVWEADLRETPEWAAGQGKMLPFEPDHGWAKCMYMSVPPDSEAPSSTGMHFTRTVDLVYLFDPLILVLEDGEVPVEPGDLVVQRGTVHDWRNPGPGPARVLGFMWAVGDPAPDS